MKSAITIALVLAASPVFADEAASALADCKVHQQRLEDLESNALAPAQAAGSGTGWQPQRFGDDEVAHERALTDEACAYARELRRASGKTSAKPAPVETVRPFRSDEPTTASKPPVFDEHPPVAPAPPPPPPPRPMRREVMRRPPPPPPPPQANVGGTKARHAPDESQQQTPPQ